MVSIKLNDNKRKTIKEINDLEREILPYEVAYFISKSFRIKMEETIKAYTEGRILVTKNKKLFSSFLFEEWMDALGIHKEKDNVKDDLTKTIWYDFSFSNDHNHVLRYSESKSGLNDDTLLHIFYEGDNEWI